MDSQIRIFTEVILYTMGKFRFCCSFVYLFVSECSVTVSEMDALFEGNHSKFLSFEKQKYFIGVFLAEHFLACTFPAVWSQIS